MDAKIIQPCAEGHLLSLQFLVTNYIFFLNKIMYTSTVIPNKDLGIRNKPAKMVIKSMSIHALGMQKCVGVGKPKS